jgi:hypothetical protein
MITVITAIVILSIVWGGFILLLRKAIVSEKRKRNG